METKKITFSAVLIALGVVTSNIIFIPVGAAKCFPVQSVINVLAAVFLGPSYGLGIAFCISLFRNILGTGSPLAFPGSMVGVFLAAMLFKKTKSLSLAAIGEILGTGIIGGLLSFPIAKFLLGKEVAALFYVTPFLISAIGGSLIAYFAVKLLRVTKVVYLKSKAWRRNIWK